MERVQGALSLFENGMNCSQAILAAFGEPYGVRMEDAARIGRPLGGGIARMGLTCGAVTGAIMVLGFRAGDGAAEPEARNAIAASAKDFVHAFESRRKTTLCRELLGVDIGTEAGLKRFKEQKLIATVCPQLVRDAAEILLELEKS